MTYTPTGTKIPFSIPLIGFKMPESCVTGADVSARTEFQHTHGTTLFRLLATMVEKPVDTYHMTTYHSKNHVLHKGFEVRSR